MRSVLLCLHGWGGSKESFTELRAALKGSNVEILTPDLPGFGAQSEPKKPWTVNDYADWVEAWLEKKMKAKKSKPKIHLLGHSHGGRIAITMALRKKNKIEHLYLCAAAGIRHPRHFKRIIGLTLAKSGGFFLSIPGLKQLAPVGKKLLYKLVRVHDYEKASPVMRQTLINVTAQDFRPLVAKVKTPTDIFWGEADRMTPVKDGRLMHKLIKKSKLHTFKGVRHGVHRDRAAEIARSVLQNIG